MPPLNAKQQTLQPLLIDLQAAERSLGKLVKAKNAARAAADADYVAALAAIDAAHDPDIATKQAEIETLKTTLDGQV